VDKTYSSSSDDAGSDCALFLGSNEQISDLGATKTRVFSQIYEKKFAFCAI
jgi:hypothetical protein